MGSKPARPALEEEGPDAFPPAETPSAGFPELDEYVDLVSELEEILRGAAAEPAGIDPAPAPVAEAAPIAPSRLRAPARLADASTEPDGRPIAIPAPEADAPADPRFWQVDDSSWAAAPAWREQRRTRGADLFIIGALVVLIAGGGAYSAIRLGDDAPDTIADGAIGENASRAEAGLGVPFAAIGRTSLLRDDPTAPVPSLDAAVAGAAVTPLPVIVAPPVEVTQPILLADAAPVADPAPAVPPAAMPEAAPATPDVAPAAVGGPLVPFTTGDLEAGVPVTMTTTVKTWVNMRAGPDNAEPVVVVVSPDATVTVRSCDYWCSVTVNGQDGYIFQDFLVDHP